MFKSIMLILFCFLHLYNISLYFTSFHLQLQVCHVLVWFPCSLLQSLIYKFVHFVEVMVVLFSKFCWPWRKRIVTKIEAEKFLKKYHTFLMGQFHMFEVSEICWSFTCIRIIPYFAVMFCVLFDLVFSVWLHWKWLSTKYTSFKYELGHWWSRPLALGAREV
jgi:hypothetical protein